MPVSLLSAKIRGVRSYSPDEHKAQTIEFMPLTLIVGANGSGKTTVIESLKFIISGDEPPLSDSRRNFLHTAKNPNDISTKKTACASIEVCFQNSKDETCLARREISTAGASKTAAPSISSSFKIGNKPWTNVHKQDDWNKTLPMLFDMPNQAVLNNIVLCHQDDNLWCMGDSNAVKQIFDQIFGCEQYKKEIKYIEAEIKSCKSDLALGERDAMHNREKVKRVEVLSGEVENLKAEIERCSFKTSDLDLKIKELANYRESISGEIAKIETKMRELDSLKQMAKLEKDLLQNKCDQAELEDNLSSKQQKLVKCIKNLDSIYQGLLFKIRSRESNIKRFTEQIAKAQADPNAKDLALVAENLKKMRSITSKMSPPDLVTELEYLIEDQTKIIDSLKLRIKDDSATKLVAEIDSSKMEIEDCKKQLITIEEQKKELSVQQAQAEAELEKVRAAAKEAHKRLSETNERISSMQKSLVAETDLNELRSRLKENERKSLELRDKRSMIAGSKAQIEREMARIRAELESYSKVNSQYAQCLGKVACNKIVISDLEKLKECIQKSIISFHNQMIVKINEVLRVRWRQIYQGPDIDYIELVDEEITKGKDKKGFNYYLAMRKGGIKMKMREKSSAGQKALASIILRMTLAELFVKDFAFIALDEPTANLDLANVKSLASAIALYVKRRSMKGVNIQWIIITHDEQFLDALDAECSPYYYKVQLDSESCSKIVKMSSARSE